MYPGNLSETIEEGLPSLEALKRVIAAFSSERSLEIWKLIINLVSESMTNQIQYLIPFILTTVSSMCHSSELKSKLE